MTPGRERVLFALAIAGDRSALTPHVQRLLSPCGRALLRVLLDLPGLVTASGLESATKAWHRLDRQMLYASGRSAELPMRRAYAERLRMARAVDHATLRELVNQAAVGSWRINVVRPGRAA